MHFSNLYFTLWPVNEWVNCFWAQRNHHSINCTSHVFLILTAKFCQKFQISRINIPRIPHEYEEMFLDFIKVSSYVISKIQQIFLAKHHSYQFSGSGLLAQVVPLKVLQ